MSDLRPLCKFPSVQAFAKAKPDARMVLQVLGMLRDTVTFEIPGRAHHGKTQFFGHPDRNHVALNEFAELYACVVLFRNQIDRIIRGGDLQHDLRITTNELSQLRQKHCLGRCAWNDEPYPARRCLLLFPGSPQVLARSAPMRVSVRAGAWFPPQLARRFALFAQAIGSPSLFSRPRIEWLSADCEIPRRAAARVKLRSWATVANAESSPRSFFMIDAFYS